jgi:hypothetical protein
VAVVPIDGMVRVSWLTACAVVQSPTVAEANAGTALEGFILPDGLDIGMATGRVDLSNLGSTFGAGGVGRRTPSISIGFHHDGVVDTAYNLMVYRAVGFLLCRYGVLKTTAYTIADKVKVYPAMCGEPVETKPAPDGTWDFVVDIMVTSDPATRAVMA